MQARILSCSAWVGWKRTRPVTVSRWPPALSFATIFGTVPSWWTPESTRPLETAETPFELRDLARLALREGQLRAGEEEVLDEVRAGLAELREVGDRRRVRLDELTSAAAAAEPAAASGNPPPPPAERAPEVSCVCGDERHREIGADARERVERGLLRVVEASRQRRDHDHERDADREAGDREDRPSLLAESSSLRRYER